MTDWRNVYKIVYKYERPGCSHKYRICQIQKFIINIIIIRNRKKTREKTFCVLFLSERKIRKVTIMMLMKQRFVSWLCLLTHEPIFLCAKDFFRKCISDLMVVAKIVIIDTEPTTTTTWRRHFEFYTHSHPHRVAQHRSVWGVKATKPKARQAKLKQNDENFRILYSTMCVCVCVCLCTYIERKYILRPKLMYF